MVMQFNGHPVRVRIVWKCNEGSLYWLQRGPSGLHVRGEGGVGAVSGSAEPAKDYLKKGVAHHR